MLGLVCKYFNKDSLCVSLPGGQYQHAGRLVFVVCWPGQATTLLYFSEMANVQAGPKIYPMCDTLRPVPLFNLSYSYTI